MKKLKRLNIAIILMLLVFQTVLSPIPVFADDVSSIPSELKQQADNEKEIDIDGEEISDNDSVITEEESTSQTSESDIKEDIGEAEEGDNEAEETTNNPAEIVPEPLAAQQIPAKLTSFEMKIGGETVRDGSFDTELPQDTLANFTVKLSVPLQNDQEEAWGDGSWFEFQLPKSLIDFDEAFKGSKSENGITYTYTTTGNKVRVELNGMEPGSGSSQPAELIISFNSGFNNLSDEREQELEIPSITGGSETIKAEFTFLPSTSKKEVSKSAVGTPTPTASGNHEMEWQVWVNEAGKTLSNPTLKDIATSSAGSPSHEIVDNSVNVYQYEVGLSGVKNKNGDGDHVLTDGNWGDINSTLTGKYAYKITYKTAVSLDDNKRDGAVNFNNQVEFTNDGQSNETSKATHTITYGKALDKKLVSNTNYQTKWRIDYNHNLLNISQAKLTDTITGPHEIDASSIKVYKMNDAAGNVVNQVSQGEEITKGFEISPNTGNVKTFTLTFDSAISDAYTIVYDANYNKQDFYETVAGPFNNSVTSDSGKTENESYQLVENLLNKSHKVDFDNKVITWTINIKSDNPNKPINNLTLTDTFTADSADGAHELIANSVKLNGKNATYTLIGGDKKKGFTITDINVAPGQTATITYQTSFAIDDNGVVQNQGYGNTAATHWISGGKTYDKTVTDKYVPDTTTVNNGSKSGKFDYVTQELTWDVKVNINKKNINGAVLVDTVGDGHKYVPETIEVLPLTNLGGSDTGGTIGTTPISSDYYVVSDESDKGFTLTFIDSLPEEINNQAYVVRYKTMDDDKILGVGSGNASEKGNVYTNGATFKTKGTKEFTLDSTPVIIDENVANNLITKNTPTQNAAKELITWTLDVNKSHSDLGKDVTLTDLPGNNLMLLEDSIKIAPYTVTPTGIKNGDWQTPAQLGLSVTFDKVGGFSIVFPDLIKKGYRVKYETVGFGKINDSLVNTATLNYTGQTMANQQTEDEFNGKFSFSSSESSFTSTRGSAKFKKVGIDTATGQIKENLAGVTFQLIKRTATPNEYIIKTATTDANGELTFDNVPYNDYLIREVAAPTGYDKMKDYPFKLNGDTTLDSKPDLVTQLVNTTTVIGRACTQFEITINDIDGESITTGTVTLIDKNGVETAPYKVTNGKVKLPKNFTAGEYTVIHSVEGNLGKVTVKYGVVCKDTIQPAPKCDNFTIVVEDTEGIRTNIKDLTLKSGTTEVKASPDASGKFIFESNKNNPTNGVKPGEYMVYEGKQFLGTVNLTYTKDCGHEFIVKQLPKCEEFELTVKDVDGNKITDSTTTIVVKDANGKEIINTTTTTGVIKLTNLEPDTYTVEVNGEKIGTFQTNSECEATVQPAPKCDLFTLTVKDENGNPRPNVSNITIKDKTTGAIIATNKTTNELGQITIDPKEIPSGDYSVYQGDLFIGKITVKYSERCNAEISAAPACPSFTLTVLTQFGTPNANAKITIKDAKGNSVKGADDNEVLTTSIAGTVVLPNEAIKQGTYNVYEGSSLIGSFTVKDTCSATVQPSTGGGGRTPDPEKPVDPEKPKPEPEKPVDPNKPKPEPEKPVKPKPEKPVDPNKPNPDPEKPVNPNKPNPDPEKPVNPNKPNPGNPTTDTKNPTSPGKPETTKPSVEEVIDQGKELKPYDPSTADKDTLDAHKDLLDKYNKLSKEEQAEVDKYLDIDKIKADAKEMEAQLNAQGKLPQTNGANQTALTLIGVALVLGALFLLRRRNEEVK
ncbi:collagen binding domain-containing protein [Lysinibacillus xylanilyticus]|uniref:collagen binding domain-containing protein n=1 Tax=Lysinibacillus xylanilyticus TaxID=582475 RepID=UPI003D04557D